jgi:hypothetical protein
MPQLHEFVKRGHAAQVAANVEIMLAVLREKPRGARGGLEVRDVYKTRHGTYAITYGGGEIAADSVQHALAVGRITETYPGEGLEFYRLPELVMPLPRGRASSRNLEFCNVGSGRRPI